MLPLKVLCSWYNFLTGTETLSLSVHEPIAMQFFAWWTVPQFWIGVELEVECGTQRNSSTLATICLLEPKFYLSPFTSQSQYKFCMGGPTPMWPRGRARGSGVVPRETPPYLPWSADIKMLFLSINEPIAIQILLGGPSPNLAEGSS